MFSRTLIDRLAAAKLVVGFTGAGVSAESGVATFRATGGLWTKFKPEELANVDAFLANPQMVWEWYQARRDVILQAAPNPGHRALAELEDLVPKVSIITQNIDGLHVAAGSSEVIELHGNIRKNFCQSCGRRYDDESLLVVEQVQRCECGGSIRPDVVWFGEMLPEFELNAAHAAAEGCDLMLVVGTSGAVYPAAGLAEVARRSGARVVVVNPNETGLDDVAHRLLRQTAAQALPQLLAEPAAPTA